MEFGNDSLPDDDVRATLYRLNIQGLKMRDTIMDALVDAANDFSDLRCGLLPIVIEAAIEGREIIGKKMIVPTIRVSI